MGWLTVLDVFLSPKTRKLSGEPVFKTPRVLNNAFIPHGKYAIILEAKKMRIR